MAATTLPPDSSVETTANCAEPAKVVADMTTAASASKSAVGPRTPNEAPKAAAASPIGAISRAPSRYRDRLGPVTRQVEPEREARVRAVAAEAALDRRVLYRAAAVQPGVLGASPRVEYERGIAAHQHHHVRGRVRPDAGKREQPCPHVVVGELVSARAAQFLEVDGLVGDGGGERPQVRAAITRA